MKRKKFCVWEGGGSEKRQEEEEGRMVWVGEAEGISRDRQAAS
jgi:hypothetical protein